MEKGRFGINIKRYCRSHEAAVLAAIEARNADENVLEEHREKIQWLQHERLVHLIVTVMVVIGELFTLGVVLFTWNILAVVVMLGLTVLLGFYFFHYFFLENTVQRWYVIADQLRSIKSSASTTENP